MAVSGQVEIHSFYCLNCGQKAMDLARRKSKIKEKFHKKKLYCPHCRITINCVECRNDMEEYEFKDMYENGEFENEKQEALSFVRDSRLGQVDLGKREN